MKSIYETVSNLFFIVILLYGIIAKAQWSLHTNINNPICVEINNQQNPKITGDGDGGAIIVWSDERGTHPDIFMQRIDKEGFIKWAANGDTVCNAIFSQVEPDIVSDGTGGGVIVWKDFRSGSDYDIYAQRVDADGNSMWQNNGVPVCTAGGYQEDFNVVSDGNGGAIIVWEDGRVGGDFNIYAQRISSNGNLMWASDGIAVCSAANHQLKPTLISDENGGAIITWEDKRTGTFADIYAQKVNANGEFQWTSNGIPVCAAADGQEAPKLTGDGFGGAVIVWRDHRTAFFDLYIQLIDSLGVTQWQSNGIKLLQGQSNPPDRVQIVSDNSGGAIVCWDQDRIGQNYDIFAQRVDNSGSLLWLSGGLHVCSADMGQSHPNIISDGLGGAIITWYDYRNQLDWDIYAQRINSLGEFNWVADGIQVSTASNDQIVPLLASDGNSGAIITWTDYRNSSIDIYVQKINKDGGLGNLTLVENEQLPSGYFLSQNYPNPFNPSTKIFFSIPQEEFISLKVFNSLGEEVADLVNETKPAGSYEVEFNSNSHSGPALPAGRLSGNREISSGIYFYTIKAGSYFQTRKMMLVK